LYTVEKCTCEKTVYYDDVIEFDQSHPYNVYDNKAACVDCEFYYSRNCKPYLNSIVNFAKNKQKIETPIGECKDFTLYELSNTMSSYD
jgi:hypothetical protein